MPLGTLDTLLCESNQFACGKNIKSNPSIFNPDHENQIDIEEENDKEKHNLRPENSLIVHISKRSPN